MIRQIVLIAIAASSVWPAAAQQQPPVYSRVTYLREKPGSSAAQRSLQRDMGDKGAAGYIASGHYTGFVRMTRVFPSSPEVGHDVLYFYTSNTPPDFAAPPGDAFFKAAGVTREEWSAKSRALSDIVKQEIWRSVFAHGSLTKGDTVRLRRIDAAPGESSAVRAYWRDWQAAIFGKMVAGGTAKSLQSHELLLTPESAPYNFVGLEAYTKGDGPFQAWPNRQETFRAAHPGKDYHAYRETGDKYGLSVGSAIYRVQTAIWK